MHIFQNTALNKTQSLRILNEYFKLLPKVEFKRRTKTFLDSEMVESRELTSRLGCIRTEARPSFSRECTLASKFRVTMKFDIKFSDELPSFLTWSNANGLRKFRPPRHKGGERVSTNFKRRDEKKRGASR